MKHALVTGCASGIGLATTEHFVTAGWAVSGIDLNRTVEGSAVGAQLTQGDLRSPEVARNWAQASIATFGPIHALVNCAGSHPPERRIDVVTPESLHDLFDVNVVTAFNATRAAIESLRETRGAVVNVSSLVASIGQEAALEYCATKGALTSMTKALAVDEARHGVRVNSVAPGAILTPLAEQLNTPDDLAVVARWAWMNRLGSPGEVAETIYFLASGATFVTGAELIVSGGADLAYGPKTPE